MCHDPKLRQRCAGIVTNQRSDSSKAGTDEGPFDLRARLEKQFVERIEAGEAFDCSECPHAQG